jgi:hypothetical protein
VPAWSLSTPIGDLAPPMLRTYAGLSRGRSQPAGDDAPGQEGSAEPVARPGRGRPVYGGAMATASPQTETYGTERVRRPGGDVASAAPPDYCKCGWLRGRLLPDSSRVERRTGCSVCRWVAFPAPTTNSFSVACSSPANE